MASSLVLTIPGPTLAQCTGSLSSMSHDSLVLGSGNDSHTFSFAQFDPSVGTLTQVSISAVVSVNYGFSLTNINSTTTSFSLGVGRRDNIQSSALVTPYNNTINADLGTFDLAPNQTVTEGLATVIDRYDNSIDITTNVAPFIGNGTVGFSYAPRTYANHSGSPTYNYSATANDSIHFFITYFYCSNITLATKISAFTVQKEDDAFIDLNWVTENEQAGTRYEVQQRNDGNQFSTAGSLTSAENNPDAKYFFKYAMKRNEEGKIYFRLKMTNAESAVSYSEIRMVDLGEPKNAFLLFPNPADDFIQVVLQQPGSTGWYADIVSGDGRMIVNHLLLNSGNTRIDFHSRLSSGSYFIRIMDSRNSKTFVRSFIVR
ncbi:MAG: choice-of-anchor E domain-containing protein [Chitinophagales bacterium]